MPEYDSQIITRDFLREVRDGLVYIPKYNQLKLSPCPEPPTNLEVHHELITLIEQNFEQITE